MSDKELDRLTRHLATLRRSESSYKALLAVVQEQIVETRRKIAEIVDKN